MKTQEEKFKSFEQVVLPVIKWLSENSNPHATIIVSNTNAELSEGVMAINTLDTLNRPLAE